MSGPKRPHPNCGLVDDAGRLTEAGVLVRKWNKPKEESE